MTTHVKMKELDKHYRFTFRGVKLDPYRIMAIYGIEHPAHQHALKKLLRAGRSIKSLAQDIDEVILSLNRWKEMLDEDGNTEAKETNPERNDEAAQGGRPDEPANGQRPQQPGRYSRIASSLRRGKGPKEKAVQSKRRGRGRVRVRPGANEGAELGYGDADKIVTR